jgi:hypothetical protein
MMSTILLMIEAVILILPLAIALFYAIRGVRVLRTGLHQQVIPTARTYVTQTETVTRQVSAKLVAPPLRVKSTASGFRAGARALVKGSGRTPTA